MRNFSVFLIVITLFGWPQNVLSQSQTNSSKIVRVLSFNIYHGETVAAEKKFDLDLLAKVISDARPDLVALQEVDDKTNRARNYDLVTELGLRTKMSPLFGKAMNYDGGGYGEGILSNYSFLATQNHALPAREGKEPRAATEVQVVLKSGDTIRFIGTHLDHTKDNTDRMNQVKELNRLFVNSQMPTILAGDLNAEPDSEAMQLLFEHWSPSIKNTEFTYPADVPAVKIDYILFRPAHKWRIIESKVIDEKIASDHRPILTILELL